MPTLLLRFAGPMQSWGTRSRFSVRDTGLEPSKSGVIGVLCAALGKPRDESDPGNRHLPPLGHLASLRMGVRIDHEGVVKRDFHTAGGTHRRGDEYGVAKANRNKPQTVVSERYYLADADFLVGLESEDLDLLHRLKSALAAPRWQLFLGRKSFVPGIPINVPGGLVNAALRDALTAIPWTPRGDSDPPQRLRLVLEVGTDVEAEVRSDVPLSFAERRFTIRFVLQDQILTPKGDASCISPD